MSTPEEVFSLKKLDVAHFRILFSSVYCHVSKDTWKNLEPTAKLGIFFRYTDTPHNYRVYLWSHRMTIVLRDVKLDENNAMRISFRGICLVNLIFLNWLHKLFTIVGKIVKYKCTIYARSLFYSFCLLVWWLDF